MARKQQAHGDFIVAPGEFGEDEPFVAGEASRVRGARSESPVPGPVTTSRRNPRAAQPAEPSAWARTWSGVKLLFGVMLVVGLAASVAWGAHRYALTTSRFAIRKVEVQGADRLTSDRARQVAGADVGLNLLRFDPEKAEKQLLTVPWVREASVQRQLPNTVLIRVIENEPGALLALPDQLYLVTRGGEPFKPLEEGDPYDLPVITGISAEDLARDREEAISRIQVGLEVLRRYAELAVSQVHGAEEVHLTPSGEAILSVGRNGISLHLGNGPWAKKLLMAERVLSRLGARGQTPGVIFLDNSAHPERVVVRMR